MDDLISRQAAIEDIKECAQAAHSIYEWDMEQGYINAIECLEELPSAQPEITRCKDCRHNHDCNIQYHAQAGEEFYCGAAERRTDE